MNTNAPKTNLKGEPITLDDRFLTAKEVAVACGIGHATIYRAMGKNQFPLSHKITVNRVGWLESDIKEFKSLGFDRFVYMYSNKIKLQRINNKANAAQANAA